MKMSTSFKGLSRYTGMKYSPLLPKAINKSFDKKEILDLQLQVLQTCNLHYAFQPSLIRNAE